MDPSEGEPYEPVDLSRVRTISIRTRRHLVEKSAFAIPVGPRSTAAELLDSLPRILAAGQLRELALAMARARAGGRHVVVGFGGHVIKVGLAPLLADLAERGAVTAFATNGAGAIHDLEVALLGETSEVVADTIADGRFGMVQETADAFARIAARGAASGKGFGWALGRELEEGDYPHREASLAYRLHRAGVPLTVHVALGTDTVHAVPGADGAHIGACTHTDFRILAAIVADLSQGVFVNIGSAVLLPEVFLKCVSVARNLGAAVDGVTSANLDMVQHYRPLVNLLARPVERGIALTGHHEILVPLLRIEMLRRLEELGGPRPVVRGAGLAGRETASG